MSFFLINNHPATVAKMVILIVDHAVLAGSDTLYLLVRLNAVEVADTSDVAMRELRRVTDLEGNLFHVVELAPRILSDKIKAVHIDGLAILRLRIVAIGDVDDVTTNVLLDHKPRATTQAQSLTLSDGMKPIAVVLTQHLAGLQFHDLTRTLTQVTLYKLIVIDLAQKTDTLAVLALYPGCPCAWRSATSPVQRWHGPRSSSNDRSETSASGSAGE